MSEHAATMPWHRRRLATLGSLGARFSGVRASAIYGLSGGAFAAGNLLLARGMEVAEFGRFALAIALFNIFAVVAPIGLDQVMLRHRIALRPGLLALLVAVAAGFGAGVGLALVLLAGFGTMAAAMVALAILGGGLIFVIGARLRAELREMEALVAATAASWLLLAIGALGLLVPMPDALLPLALFAAGNLVVAGLGFAALARPGRALAGEPVRIFWREAISLLSIVAIGAITIQLERLLIPVALTLADLALFSVLASVALFPFRMASAGAGFGLIPKLRVTPDRTARLKLVRDELLSVGALLAAATLGVVVAAPHVAHVLTAGRYEIGLGLVLAACFNGGAKVLQALPRAILIGVGSERDMALLSRWGWLGLVAGVACAFVFAPWGLAGVICGIGLGSLAGSVPAAWLAARRLKG
jgi:O-antigen/teichoic acid export membrane protein